MTEQRVLFLVVLVTTEAGKSKPALELAQNFNGEVISADTVMLLK